MRTLSMFGLLLAILGLCAHSADGANVFISYGEASQICSGSVTDLNYAGAAPFTYSTSCVPKLGATINVNVEGDFSNVRLSLDTAGPSENTQAAFRIRDTITAAGGTGSGTLQFGWTIDGSLSADDRFLTSLYISDVTGFQFADYRACGQNAIGLPCFSPLNSNVTVHDTVTVSVPFTFGSPTIVDWTFGAVMNCINLNSPCPGVTGTNAMNFDAVHLLPLIILDSNGSQVLGASVLSDSGFSYAIAAPDAVPEPSSLLVLGTGLAVLVCLRERGKNGNRKLGKSGTPNRNHA